MVLTKTQWASTDDKEKFINQFKRLVINDFKEKDFSESFYKRLSMTFRHIAHYDRGGFWSTWFSSRQRQAEFLKRVLRHRPNGSPEYTFCDAERAIQNWLTEHPNYLHRLNTIINEYTTKRELLLLKELKVKYETNGRENKMMFTKTQKPESRRVNGSTVYAAAPEMFDAVNRAFELLLNVTQVRGNSIVIQLTEGNSAEDDYDILLKMFGNIVAKIKGGE